MSSTGDLTSHPMAHLRDRTVACGQAHDREGGQEQAIVSMEAA